MAIEERFACWLVGPDGIGLRVDAGGLLIGRTATCDIVLADARASNRHAFVRVGPAGPEFVQLGRNASYVNKERVEALVTLAAGDRIDVPGLRLVVETRGPAPDAVAWVVERTGSGSYGIHRSPFAVGGGDDDHLRIRGWPPSSLSLRVAQGALLARLSVEARVDDAPVGIGEVIRLGSGSTLRIGAETLRFFAEGASLQATTLRAESAPFPEAILIEDLEAGADLAVALGGRSRSLRLDVDETRLVAQLLRPGRGQEAGDYVLDDDLLGAVWPGQVQRDDEDLSRLTGGLRTRLLNAGIDPFTLLERSPRGDAWRVRIGPLTRVGRA